MKIISDLLFLYLYFVISRICGYTLLEPPDRLSKAFAQRREFTWTKENKSDNQYNHYFRQTQTKHCIPPLTSYVYSVDTINYLYFSTLMDVYQLYSVATNAGLLKGLLSFCLKIPENQISGQRDNYKQYRDMPNFCHVLLYNIQAVAADIARSHHDDNSEY